MHAEQAKSQLDALATAVGALMRDDAEFPPEAVPAVTAALALAGGVAVNIARIADALERGSAELTGDVSPVVWP